MKYAPDLVELAGVTAVIVGLWGVDWRWGTCVGGLLLFWVGFALRKSRLNQ